MKTSTLIQLQKMDDLQRITVTNEYHLRKKSTGVTYALWFFLGLFGAHHFYLSYKTSSAFHFCWAIVYLLTGGVFMIGWFTDLIGNAFYASNINDALEDKLVGEVLLQQSNKSGNF